MQQTLLPPSTLSDCKPQDVERAERFATMVAIHLARGEWDGAHAAVSAAHRDWLDAQPRKNVRETPLVDTGLPMRECNALERFGVMTIGQLAECSMDELRGVAGLGEGAIRRFALTLEAYGCYDFSDTQEAR